MRYGGSICHQLGQAIFGNYRLIYAFSLRLCWITHSKYKDLNFEFSVQIVYIRIWTYKRMRRKEKCVSILHLKSCHFIGWFCFFLSFLFLLFYLPSMKLSSNYSMLFIDQVLFLWHLTMSNPWLFPVHPQTSIHIDSWIHCPFMTSLD